MSWSSNDGAGLPRKSCANKIIGIVACLLEVTACPLQPLLGRHYIRLGKKRIAVRLGEKRNKLIVGSLTSVIECHRGSRLGDLAHRSSNGQLQQLHVRCTEGD